MAHLTLRDPEWLFNQLHGLATAGVRLAMIVPALVDGRSLSHPDHDHYPIGVGGTAVDPDLPVRRAPSSAAGVDSTPHVRLVVHET